ncbi:TPA: type II toxin-antitoxin system Phd/YefM family antitoxin [Candidatus Bipolaricaulota bacterium]|nr:type II toxin-antitoxin system Phd/YefM family antitoxin [Candidatus Bipolaricaulota bacterium]
MKVAPVKEFKAHATQYLRGGETRAVLITRRGKLVGFSIPVEDQASLPWTCAGRSFRRSPSGSPQ